MPDAMQLICKAISQSSGLPFSLESRRSVGGGCINSAYVLEGGGQSWFVKTNRAAGLDMFAAEAAGLREIAAAAGVQAPQPLCCGIAGNMAYLVMQYLPLGGSVNGELLGRQLAAMHRHTRDRFGWHRDNTIGSTPQVNTPEPDWTRFWQQHRLGYQLQLAQANGAGRQLNHKGERLLAQLSVLLDGHQPRASLLHGDLWSGNYGSSAGVPVIFDPAIYYGDREADLAMTELFGGFPAAFHGAYREAWPLDDGYAVRRTLYNLYHILNHFNLFGGGYAQQAEAMLDALLAEL